MLPTSSSNKTPVVSCGQKHFVFRTRDRTYSPPTVEESYLRLAQRIAFRHCENAAELDSLSFVILCCMIRGYTRSSHIAQRTGEEHRVVAAHLDQMLSAGCIESIAGGYLLNLDAGHDHRRAA